MGARGWRVTTFRPAGIDAPRASDGALSDFGPRERGPAGRANQVAVGRLVDGRGAAAGFTRVEGAPVLVWFELARFVIKANQGDLIRKIARLHKQVGLSPASADCQEEIPLRTGLAQSPIARQKGPELVEGPAVRGTYRSSSDPLRALRQAQGPGLFRRRLRFANKPADFSGVMR